MASHSPNIFPFDDGRSPENDWELSMEKAYAIFMGAIYRKVYESKLPIEHLSPKELGEYTVWASQQQEAELPVAA